MTNQEKFKTPAERHKAFLKFCRENAVCETCRLAKDAGDCDPDLCRYSWLDLEYDEKPMRSSRDEETRLNPGQPVQEKKYHLVYCGSPDRMYRSGRFTDPGIVVSEYNWVSDAMKSK